MSVPKSSFELLMKMFPLVSSGGMDRMVPLLDAYIAVKVAEERQFDRSVFAANLDLDDKRKRLEDLCR